MTAPPAPPLISVIVLNWNGAAHLPRCLESLAAQTRHDFETLVLDNASTDGAVDDLEDRYPDVRLVRFASNLGFAPANNRGAALARGRWLAFLNNDAFPESDWLEQLMLAADRHPEAVLFASRIVDAADPTRIQAAGDAIHVSGAAWPLENGAAATTAFSSDREVFSACAAAALVERRAFHQVGGFTEAFVSHLEDVDLGFRLRLCGHRCFYVPGAVAAHVGSASYGRESERTVYQVQRNLIWMYAANMPGHLVWKYLPAHLVANIFFVIYYSLKGLGRAVWRAKWDALRGLAAALARRKIIQAGRSVEPRIVEGRMDHGLLTPYLLGRRGAWLRQGAADSAGRRGTRHAA